MATTTLPIKALYLFRQSDINPMIDAIKANPSGQFASSLKETISYDGYNYELYLAHVTSEIAVIYASAIVTLDGYVKKNRWVSLISG